MTLPPDPDCAAQDMIRAYYQCYYWVHCFQEIISPILFQDYRWFFDCESVFIWAVSFEGYTFPSLATKSGSRKRKKVNGYEGVVKGKYNVKKSKTLKSF